MNHRSIQAVQAVPLSDELAQQFQEPTLHAASGGFLRLTLFGICQTGLGHFVVFAAGQTLALLTTGLL